MGDPIEDLMARVRTLEARKDLEDAMLIHASLEKQATERIKEHAIWLAHHEEQQKQQVQFNRDLDERIANLVSAIGEMIRQGKSPLQ